MSEKLQRAARLVNEAREIKDRYRDGDTMSKADAEHIDRLLREASNLRKDHERESQLGGLEDWLGAPEYRHDGDAGQARGIDGDLADQKQGGMAPTTKSFLTFVRHGLDAVERKADLVEDGTGELLVPVDYAGTIIKDSARQGVFRNLAFVRPTRRNRVDVGSVSVTAAGWGKLELGATAPDVMGAADSDQIEVHDLTALVKIGVDELEDTDAALEATIRQAVAEKFAEIEDDAFAGGAGDASNQPFGVTNGVTQRVQVVADNVVTADDLKSLKYAVPAWARRNGVYVATSAVEEQVALLKDNNGNYLLQPSVRDDEPQRFAGRPFYTADGLPGTKGAVFGDVRQGYMIADRRRVTVQRLVEIYATEGKIGLLFTHRVGGDTIRPNALAYLELDASAV